MTQNQFLSKMLRIRGTTKNLYKIVLSPYLRFIEEDIPTTKQHAIESIVAYNAFQKGEKVPDEWMKPHVLGMMKGKRKDVSSTTLDQSNRLIARYYQYLYEEEKINYELKDWFANNVFLVRRGQMDIRSKIIPHPTLVKLFSCIDDPEDHLILGIIYAGAFRPREIIHDKYQHVHKTKEEGIGIRPCDVMFDSNTIRVTTATKTRVECYQKLLDGIPNLNPFAGLREIIEKNKIGFEEYIFHKTLEKLDRHCKKYMETYQDKYGCLFLTVGNINNFSAGMLRHSMARYFYLQVNDVLKVKALLRHGDVNTTMKYVFPGAGAELEGILVQRNQQQSLYDNN